MVASATPNLPSNGPLFALSKSKSGRRYQIHEKEQDGAVVYNATVHNWKKGPSIELRAGADEEAGEVVALSSIDCAGFSAQLALTSAEKTDPTALDYEHMRDKRQLGFNEFQFESDELNEARERRAYTWIRTGHHPGAFECRDTSTGQCLAHYTSRGMLKWTRIGTLQFDVEHPSPRALHFILLMFITWSEMENREQAVLASISH